MFLFLAFFFYKKKVQGTTAVRDFLFDIMKYRIMIGSYGAFIICGVAKRGVFLSGSVSSLGVGTFRSQSNPQHLMCVHLEDSICFIMRKQSL